MFNAIWLALIVSMALLVLFKPRVWLLALVKGIAVGTFVAVAFALFLATVLAITAAPSQTSLADVGLLIGALLVVQGGLLFAANALEPGSPGRAITSTIIGTMAVYGLFEGVALISGIVWIGGDLFLTPRQFATDSLLTESVGRVQACARAFERAKPWPLVDRLRGEADVSHHRGCRTARGRRRWAPTSRRRPT